MSGIVGGINLRSSGLVNNSSASDGQVLTGTGAGLPAGFEAAAGGGKILQVVNAQEAATSTHTTTCASDDTIPQVSETNILLSLDIEPASTSNKLLIFANINVVFNFSDGYGLVALFNDDTHATNALCATYVSHHANFREQLFLQHYMTSGFAIPITFKIGVASTGAGTIYHNAHTTGARVYGGKMFSEMTIMEIAV